MSDEYDQDYTDNADNVRYSSFWPLTVLLVGLLGWSGYQVFAAYSQSSVYSTEFQNAIPTIKAAENVQSKYVALMKDLVQTSTKDPYAAQIVKEATQAGMLHVNPTNSTPDASGTTTPVPTSSAPAK